MLKLVNITKDYVTGAEKVQALKGVSIAFRKNEFVSILGPSGCGKTTLLNLIGGLDRYTSGDIQISGRSTKQFKDRDWDSYRNNTIGFVFQAYNLIPHQTVLSNVELSLTLTGVSKKERRERAKAVLQKVGLGDQLHKKPAQMSGGQMQRVAIARALINNPDILLADEPTGALDTETGLQVMELLKEIARDRLVIMVTHNPELAAQYSTRIIKLLDGRVVDDSNPFDGNEEAQDTFKIKRTSMSLWTALSLSLNNLLTKKTRTILISFAGSIGIIGIALILAISTGVQLYIDNIEQETLTSYPLTLSSETMDMSGLVETFTGEVDVDLSTRDPDKIYSGSIMTKLLTSFMSKVEENDLTTFKQHIENDPEFQQYVSAVSYSYSTELHIWSDTGDTPQQINPSTTLETLMGDYMTAGMSEYVTSMTQVSTMTGTSTSTNVFVELLDNDDLLNSQYEVLAGHMPEAMDEVVLIVTKNNIITDYSLYTLGLKPQSELTEMFEALMNGEEYETTEDTTTYTYEDMLNLRFKLVLPTDYYTKSEGGLKWNSCKDDPEQMKELLSTAMELKVVGIIRPAENSIVSSNGGQIGYLSELTEYVVKAVAESEIAQDQLANPDTDVLNGWPFEEAEFSIDMIDLGSYSTFVSMVENMLGKDKMNEIIREAVPTLKSSSTYENNLTKLGIADLDSPSAINIYPKDFKSKEAIKDYIDAYNAEMEASGNEAGKIKYTDYVGLLLSGVTDIVNAITYVLVAFVAISLIVSSIMIGVITYISVLERTKEIGILRAMGASKRDISRVFNAETLIIGLTAGLLGIIVSNILLIPINFFIEQLSDISNMAVLPARSAGVLVGISMLLTLISGLIPSGFASRRDPVVALRSE